MKRREREGLGGGGGRGRERGGERGGERGERERRGWTDGHTQKKSFS